MNVAELSVVSHLILHLPTLFTCFAAVFGDLSGLYSNGFKRSRMWVVMVDFDQFFQGSFVVVAIIIDGSQETQRLLQSSRIIESTPHDYHMVDLPTPINY